MIHAELCIIIMHCMGTDEGTHVHAQSTALLNGLGDLILHHNNIREQFGRDPQVPLAIQVAIAVVTPVETSYPLTQV